jgi:hypothetical protein
MRAKTECAPQQTIAAAQMSLTLTRRTGEGTNVEGPLHRAKKEREKHWVQGHPCRTTVVI